MLRMLRLNTVYWEGMVWEYRGELVEIGVIQE